MIVKIQIAILMILLQMLIGCGEYVDVCNDNASKSKRGGGDDQIKENNDNKSKKYIETAESKVGGIGLEVPLNPPPPSALPHGARARGYQVRSRGRRDAK